MVGKQKTIKGLTIEYGGKTITNVTDLYCNTYDKNPVSFSYMENENTRVSVNCDTKDVKVNFE